MVSADAVYTQMNSNSCHPGIKRHKSPYALWWPLPPEGGRSKNNYFALTVQVEPLLTTLYFAVST